MRFDHRKYAEFYHKQQLEGGYPGKLLPFIIRELEGSHSVLDIGSGTGFFSIPLAEAGYSVTAVEPSAEMISIMEEYSSGRAISSIKICSTSWEEWRGEPHDAAISVHSLYPMPDIKKAITLISNAAVKKIIIVRDTFGMKTLSGIVRKHLGIISNRDLNSEISSILNELPVSWRVVNIREERRHLINNIQYEIDSILYQLKLDDTFRVEISAIVRNEIENIDGSCFFNSIYSDNAYIFS